MKFIFTYELLYQLRSSSTWIYFVIAFMFPFWFSTFVQPTDDAIFINSPSFILLATVFTSILWMLTAGGIAGLSATRDIQTRMSPLTYTTPISKLQYLGGRFLAALTLNALIQLAIPIGFILSFILREINPSQIGPFSMDPYIKTYFLFSLPLVFYVTAFQFSAAVIHRKAIAAFLISFLLFPIISQLFSNTISTLTGNIKIYDLIELVGISVVNKMQILTPHEQNSNSILFDTTFLFNRIIWLFLALFILAYGYIKFDFIHKSPDSVRPIKRKTLASEISAQEIIEPSPLKIWPTSPSFSLATYISQLLEVIGSSFKYIAKSKTGLTIVILYALHLVVFAGWYLESKGVPQYATIMNVLPLLTAPLQQISSGLIIIPLLITLLAGELVWRERDSNINIISDTMPLSEWVLYLGKFIGLALVIFLWTVILMVAGILIQFTLGAADIEMLVLMKALFGIQLIDYLLFAILAMTVHVVVNHKYLGHLSMIMIYFCIVFSGNIGIEHNLLIYGADPGWKYTDMRSFGSWSPIIWFKIYWAGWALLLVVVGKLFLTRQISEGFMDRIHTMKNRFTRSTVVTSLVGLFIIISSGSYIFYNTNLLNRYTSYDDRVEQQAGYEILYKKFLDSPQPVITETNIQVELYPTEKKADIFGTYTLVNFTQDQIDTICVDFKPINANRNFIFNVPAHPIIEDQTYGFNVYTLQNPLLPGDSIQLSFEVRWQTRGFQNRGMDHSVISNGSYFTNIERLPTIGYNLHRELRNNTDRKKHNLSDWSLPSLENPDSRQVRQGQELTRFRAIIGTEMDQTAVGPGNLIRKWSENNRGYFEYVTSAPIRNSFSIFSARYERYTAIWKNTISNEPREVEYNIYYHPDHTENINRIAHSVNASLDYYAIEFGPYPYDHLTIIERADTSGELNAEPTAIDFGEPFVLLNLNDHQEAFDVIFFAIAHEVAHQWWGTAQVIPAASEGATVMSESLANYSGLKVMEDTYGDRQVNLLLNMWTDAYEIPRKLFMNDLLHANDPFLGYRKGALALYALTKYIHKDAVNDALRQMIQKHGSGKPPLPNTLDLYRELKEVTPDSLRGLLSDYFEKNLYWNLKTDYVSAKKIDSENWEVTIKVNVRKFIIDDKGDAYGKPLNDWIEIGIFSNDEMKNPLYLQKHLITEEESTMMIQVSEKPYRAGIDPDHLLFDFFLGDNVKKVVTVD